jgi:serine/threonine-protein phosphatase 2B catalytic subunit
MVREVTAEIPKNGMFCDILWSDPIESEDGKVANKFQFNHNRNCSYIFGVEATTKFLNNNKLMSLIRAHEVQYEGYRMYNWKGNGPRDKERKFPQVITIFSAPKYTDSYNNKGAIIKFEVE